MLTLPTHGESLQPSNDGACSESREGLWWSILKIEKFCLTARLDAFPVGAGVGQGPRRTRTVHHRPVPSRNSFASSGRPTPLRASLQANQARTITQAGRPQTKMIPQMAIMPTSS